MPTESVPIKYTDAGQEKAALQKVAADVSGILTANEELYYIALQNSTALSMKKDSVVVTNNRVIHYRPGMLGRIDFDDFHWEQVKDVQIRQGFLAADYVIETMDGKKTTVSGLNKDQAKRVYGISQQLEQEWREKRRVRRMEEDRAKAGGVYLPAQHSAPAPPVSNAEDPVEKLAKAKRMLEQGLISEPEYEAVKAKILSAM